MSDSNDDSVTSFFLVEHPAGLFFGAVTHPKLYDPTAQVKLAWGHAARYTKMRAVPDHNLMTLRLNIKIIKGEHVTKPHFTH